MTDLEIYDRTKASVNDELTRRFGPERGDRLSGWFGSTLVGYLILKYEIARRRRPWCRLPWQRGRRMSHDPLAAKRKVARDIAEVAVIDSNADAARVVRARSTNYLRETEK